MLVSLNSIHEEKPGEKWQSIFNKTWPFYEKWFLSEGATARDGYLSSSSALEATMPELLPIYQQLCKLAGDSDIACRYLSMYNPPPYMSGCTQLAWNWYNPTLIRNYDYDPKLFEGVLLYSNWLKPVIAMSDCNWGVLDGMNADGLAVSLTFGGRKVLGQGFGIPLILRYVLETCSTVCQGIEVLRRIPVHMSYNVTLIDESGLYKTLYLSPDRKPIIAESLVATNHQEEVEWAAYAALTETTERQKFLEQQLLNPLLSADTLIKSFLRPPLHFKNFSKSFVTLYTSYYDLAEKRMNVFWQSRTLSQSFEHFTEKRELVNLSRPVGGELTR